jgi:3-hydroxy acid dehydrogenase / malonic semialdehyde reductase
MMQINNAGGAHGVAKSWDISDADLNNMIDINIKGVVYMQRAFVPDMIAANKGHIINISSISGTQSYPGGGVYCGSKHAVHAITNALRQELVATPLRVSIVSPGLAETEFSMVRFKGDSDRASSVYKGLDPLTANDVADCITFIATRPAHMQFGEMLVLPQAQASCTQIHRVPQV